MEIEAISQWGVMEAGELVRLLRQTPMAAYEVPGICPEDPERAKRETERGGVPLTIARLAEEAMVHKPHRFSVVPGYGATRDLTRLEAMFYVAQHCR